MQYSLTFKVGADKVGEQLTLQPLYGKDPQEVLDDLYDSMATTEDLQQGDEVVLVVENIRRTGDE